MAFTTQIFIFVFFPLCFIFYYSIMFIQQRENTISKIFKKCRAMDLVLAGVSCCFYAWACFDDLFRFLIYILAIYLIGGVIQNIRYHDFALVLAKKRNISDQRYVPLACPFLAVAIILITFILVHFKYTELLARVWNFFFKDTITGKSIIAPLGISFITFSAISYLADIYLGKADSGNLIDCVLYLVFFPKVVSGPIVLWRDFKGQMGDRKVSLSLVSDGIGRIMVGFAKKLILADTFGGCISSVPLEMDVPTAFGVALLYMLQIYYDFSGYSDIAIGLANLFGFSLKENFNFPYLSCSITEFWRRWHISLGMWFREYVYFPLGGSKVNKTRMIVNIGIVFLLTGIWHGAGWSYMLWGMVNGTCNIMEKLIDRKKWYRKIPKFNKWFLTMIITYFCWELFRFGSITSCKEWFLVLFGLKQFDSIPYSWQYYFDVRMITLVVIGIFGATLWGLPKVQMVYQTLVWTVPGYFVQQIIFIVLFILSVLFMVNSSYSPFIYFQY